MAEEQTINGSDGSQSNKKPMTSLMKRTITAIIYVIIWITMCALKWCVPWGNVPGGWGALGFDAVFCAIAVIGAFEFLRAVDNTNSKLKCNLSLPQKTITIAFCAMVVPLFVIVELVMSKGLLAVACAFTVYVMFLAATSVFDHYRSTVKGTMFCICCMLYCGVLSSVLSSINHLGRNSMVAILLLFVCTVFTDAGAYIIGSTLKRVVPLKLAPQLSPNKTVIGAFGGVIGGIVGAIATYYIMYLCGGMNGTVYVFGMNGVDLTFTSKYIHPIVSFILVGLATSVMAQIGDLFESAIKRECGVKDMGKLLPGHGGILDRFDSMLYCGVLVLFCFGTIII